MASSGALGDPPWPFSPPLGHRASHRSDPIGLASETYEREKDLAIGESLQGLLAQVRTALERVERGTHGLCDACGRPITRARLQALPSATLCVECQGRLER
jgi:DnaK suppressor protein